LAQVPEEAWIGDQHQPAEAILLARVVDYRGDRLGEADVLLFVHVHLLAKRAPAVAAAVGGAAGPVGGRRTAPQAAFGMLDICDLLEGLTMLGLSEDPATGA